MRILVINPNSSRFFTQLIQQSVAHLQANGAYQIDCIELEGTPPGIESQRDIDSVIEPICRVVKEEMAHTDAFVIGCFADTGVSSARELTTKPVLGLCEAALATALNMGERFGVISTSLASRNSELKLVRSYGLLDRCVGFAPIDIPVAEIPRHAQARERIISAGTTLIECGADVLVLGCAGMAPYRTHLRDTFRVPVIDPNSSAVAMAIGMVGNITGQI